MEPVLETPRDVEISAAAALRPEEVGVLVGRYAESSPSAVITSIASTLSPLGICFPNNQSLPPPPRTAIKTLCSRANWTLEAISSKLVQYAIALGGLSISPFRSTPVRRSERSDRRLRRL